MRRTCAAETSLIVATLRTQPTSTLVRCLVGTDRPVGVKPTCGCAVDPDFEYSRLSCKMTPLRERTDDAKITDSVYGVPSPLCVFWVFFFGFGLVPFLFWTTLFASWGSVGFPSVLCQEAQCRFR